MLMFDVYDIHNDRMTLFTPNIVQFMLILLDGSASIEMGFAKKSRR